MAEKSEEAEKAAPEKNRGKSKAKWIALCLLISLVSAVLTFPKLWGPPLVRAIVLSLLPSCEGFENDLNVECVGFGETRMTNGVFGGLPACPSFEYASVKYSIPGLIRKTVDSISVSGLSIKPEYAVENFSMESENHVGPLEVADDPLQGWSIKSAVVKTGDIDFGKVIPDEAPFIDKKASIFCDLKQNDGDYTLNGEGVFCGNRVEYTVTYAQKERSGNLSATVFPRLKTKNPGKLGNVEVTGAFAVASTNGYSVKSDIKASFTSSATKIFADVEAGPNGVAATITQPEVALSEKDGLVATALGMAEIPPNVTDIKVSAKVFSSGQVDIRPGAEPKWAFKSSVFNAAGSAIVDDMPVSASGAGTKFSISGIGPHYDISPFIVGYTNVTAGSFILNRGFANFMLDGKSLMISEANIGFCGGSIRLYALYFNLEKLFSGFTVFVDKVDISELFKMLPKANGTATGYLYGRIPLWVLANGEVRLRDAFVYSPPGDTGNISLSDTQFITDYCLSIGIPESESKNLARAFQNLNYNVLRFDMIQPAKEKGQIKILVKGDSPQGKSKIPVNLDITINAPVQALINYGLNPSSMVK